MREHQLYSHVGKRVRFFGLHVEEVACAAGGLLGVFVFEDLLWKSLTLGTMVLIGMNMRRLRCVWSGASPLSFVHWWLGVRPGLSSCWPQSHKRRWIG